MTRKGNPELHDLVTFSIKYCSQYHYSLLLQRKKTERRNKKEVKWDLVEGRKKGEKKEYNLALGRKGAYGIATSNR